MAEQFAVDPQQELLQALMAAYPQSIQNSANAQAEAQTQQNRMNRTRWGGKGLLGLAAGMIGNKVADKRRPAYQKSLADAMMAKSRSADLQDQIGRFRDIAQHGVEADQTASTNAKYRAKTDWERYMQDPKVYKDFKEAGRNPAVNVYPNTPETAQQAANLAAIKTRTQNAVGENQKLMQQGAAARKQISSYNMGLALLDKVETGPFTENINQIKKVAGTLGMDIDMSQVANYEQLSPIFGQFLFQGIQQTKGSVSNKEMEIFQKMNANYDYTTEGNRRLLEFAKARAERDIEIRGLVRNLRKEGKSPAEISEAADMFIENNDLSEKLISLATGGTNEDDALLQKYLD